MPQLSAMLVGTTWGHPVRTCLLTIFVTFLGMTTPGIAKEHSAPQWVVVTVPAFEAALEPLCEHRRVDGMRVCVVRTTDVLSSRQIRDGDGELLKEHVHRLCRDTKGRNYVLLVGAAMADDPASAVATTVPALRGTVGRMKGEPSDNGFGCLDEAKLPTVAVGRFPARTEKEVRQIVQKTLNFERDKTYGPWQHRLTLLVGNPGGNSAIERRFGEWFIQQIAATRFDRLDPAWTGQIVIHAPGSPFCVPDDGLRDVSLDYLQAGQLFSFYLGHSSAGGFWSEGAPFLDRKDWARLKIPSGPGVLFTCGCFGCQLNADDEGYGLAAIRNPGGPVAVFGAHGESYAAMGQLALDGMLECLNTPEPPPRLADYWLAAKSGLAHGKMDNVSFWLFDQADGSRGKVALDVQRLEHLEMWLLLGDPALRMPRRPDPIKLAIEDVPRAGKALTVQGSVPAEFAEATIHLTLERPLGSAPADPPGPPPSEKLTAQELMLAKHKRANSLVLESSEVHSRDGRFKWTLQLPADLPWTRLTARAIASKRDGAAMGVLLLPLDSSVE